MAFTGKTPSKTRWVAVNRKLKPGVRNHLLAQFVTKHKRSTDLWLLNLIRKHRSVRITVNENKIKPEGFRGYLNDDNDD